VNFGLDGKVCVVAGGSSGIGLASARLLVAEGAVVLIVGRDSERLAAASRACAGGPGRVDSLALDVLDANAGEVVADVMRERFGRCDGLVNSAGSSTGSDLVDADESAWYAQWELNVMAPRRLIEALAPLMEAGGGGAIVNISSSAGRRPSSRDAAYAVTKRAELALSQVYAEALAEKGIKVNAVAPGPTETPLWLAEGGLLDKLAAESGTGREEALAVAGERLPLGRLARPEEVAATVVALLGDGPSPRAAVWSVDGGHVPDVSS
jgi:3-oxoacyl-[acyl-carrier protein] reductase